MDEFLPVLHLDRLQGADTSAITNAEVGDRLSPYQQTIRTGILLHTVGDVDGVAKDSKLNSLNISRKARVVMSTPSPKETKLSDIH